MRDSDIEETTRRIVEDIRKDIEDKFLGTRTTARNIELIRNTTEQALRNIWKQRNNEIETLIKQITVEQDKDNKESVNINYPQRLVELLGLHQ